MKYDFEAEIKRLEGKIQWKVIYFPHPAKEHFGTNGRVTVKAVVDGHEFDGTLLPSHNGHYLVYNAFMKRAVGKDLGDTVRVMLERCDEKREIMVPEYISAALNENAVFDKFMAMPEYMRRESINSIEIAKQDETKSRRLLALVGRLAGRE